MTTIHGSIPMNIEMGSAILYFLPQPPPPLTEPVGIRV